jgi:hypothetical protein
MLFKRRKCKTRRSGEKPFVFYYFFLHYDYDNKLLCCVTHTEQFPPKNAHFSKIVLIIVMLHVVLDWQKVYKSILEKAFFFILCRFYLFLVLVLKNLENGPFLEIGHIGYKKNREFYSDFKNVDIP